MAAEGVALVEGQKAQMKSAGGSEAGSTGIGEQRSDRFEAGEESEVVGDD